MKLCYCKDMIQEMSTEAKIPHNSCDWKTIDIYVFNNGQELSPPRKYHLESEELSWWDATLKFLAKSQYGSLYSMVDLYTIKGEKIENPLLLSNGAAYVAVKPKDSFVNTGYERYLVKASRSWEKSQARRNSVEKKSEDIQDVSIIYSVNEININNDPLLIENIDSLEKPKSDSRNKFSKVNDSIMLKNGNVLKPPKKNSNLKRPSPTTRMGQNNRCANNKKETALTGNKRNSKFLIRSPDKVSKLFNLNKTQGNKVKLLKEVFEHKSNDPPLDIPITIHVTKQDKTTSTTHLISISNKSLTTDVNLLKDEEYKNEDNLDNTKKAKGNYTLLSSPGNETPNQHKVPKVTTTEEKLNPSNKENVAEELKALSNIFTTSNTNSCTIVYGVKNSGSKENTGNPETNKPNEMKNSFNDKEAKSKTQKDSSQVQSTSNYDSIHINEILNEYKSQFVFHEYIFAVPQNLNACFCGNDRKYIIFVPKERNAEENQYNPTAAKTNSTEQKETTNTNKLRNRTSKVDDKMNEQELNRNQQQNKDEGRHETRRKSCHITEPLNEINVNHIKYNIIRTDEKIKVNKSTQTEWCGILLESKIHEDGRRTFHFPPLDLIKNITNKT